MEPPMGLLRTGNGKTTAPIGRGHTANGDPKARLRRGHHVPDAAAAETPLAPLGALGRADWAWAHPDEGIFVEAFGEADRREGPLRAVLSGLTAPLSLEMPGPWFGAAAFDGRLGPDWSGFAPVRFSLPALLSWRTGGRPFLAALRGGAQARGDDAPGRMDLHVNGVHFPDAQV